MRSQHNQATTNCNCAFDLTNPLNSSSNNSSRERSARVGDTQPKKMAPAEGKTFSLEDARKHTSDKDCWLIVHGKVYDVTDFLEEHPGGYDIILTSAGEAKEGVVQRARHPFLLPLPCLACCAPGALTLTHARPLGHPTRLGKDATQDFEEIGHSNSARELLEKYLIGTYAVRVCVCVARSLTCSASRMGNSTCMGSMSCLWQPSPVRSRALLCRAASRRSVAVTRTHTSHTTHATQLTLTGRRLGAGRQVSRRRRRQKGRRRRARVQRAAAAAAHHRRVCHQRDAVEEVEELQPASSSRTSHYHSSLWWWRLFGERQRRGVDLRRRRQCGAPTGALCCSGAAPPLSLCLPPHLH